MNDQNDCQNRREAIAAFVLGELEPKTADELKRHIDSCQTCQSLYQTLTAEEMKIRSTFKIIAEKSQTIQGSLIEKLAKREPVASQTDVKPEQTGKLIWGAIIQSKITKLSAAAAILIAALLVAHQFGSSIDGASVAWGDVRDAFLAQPWVHLKYDNGTEQWYDLQNGRRYYKNWIRDGGCLFIDKVLNIRQSYVPEYGQHISEDRPAVYHDGVIPPWEPKTAWETIVEHWEKTAETGTKGHSEVKRITEQVDGKQLIRFDRYYNDAVGRRLLVKQIWADPETRLPVKVWERLQLAFREQQKREFITGEFDFPESGPASIYDLGVPRDLPIVKNYDKIPDASVVEVLDAGKAALERFPSRYHAVRWDNYDEGAGIDVVWRNGQKVHNNHYFNLQAGAPYPEHHLDLPANAEEVLSWVETQPPVSTYMFDGEKQYSRQHRTVFSTLSESKVRVMRTSSSLLPSSSRFIEGQWPYANHNPGSFQIIDDAPEELRAYIGLRIDSGDIRRDFYIDHEHDYICVRWTWWKLRAGNWEKEREYERSGFVLLPQGRWFSTRCLLTTYPDPERGTVQGGANWNIDVKAIEEDEFPPDIFNGEILLENARVETY